MSSNPDSHDLTIVVSYVAGPGISASAHAAILELGEVLAAELRERGAQVVQVNAAIPPVSALEMMAKADGVLILGGVDLDPASYGQDILVDTLWFTSREGDAYEVDLVRTAVSDEKPVLGICRGSQLINVAFGGTLIQDLGPGLHVKALLQEGSDDLGDPWTNHEVLVEPGTKLESVLGLPALDVRGGHHQAVDKLGAGLRVSALAPDGVVEAIEAVDSWVVAVQWHPEEAEAEPEVFNSLLDGYLAAVRKRAGQG